MQSGCAACSIELREEQQHRITTSDKQDYALRC
jgi:hypothetical protein